MLISIDFTHNWSILEILGKNCEKFTLFVKNSQFLHKNAFFWYFTPNVSSWVEKVQLSWNLVRITKKLVPTELHSFFPIFWIFFEIYHFFGKFLREKGKFHKILAFFAQNSPYLKKYSKYCKKTLHICWDTFLLILTKF